MTIGSLFSGIGGLELGLERAGLGPVRWQAEIDPYCRSVLAKHWPDAMRFDDVRAITRTTAASVDLICGGFPCQDVSLAGKRAGLAGERSGLWFEFLRVIEDIAPPVVVIENVLGLRTSGLPRVLADLAALGFDAEWADLSVAELGGPHLRRRLFVVAADPKRIQLRNEPGWLERSCRQAAAEPGHASLVGASSDSARVDGRRNVWPREPEAGVDTSLCAAPNADSLRRLEQAWSVATERGWARHCGWELDHPARMDDGFPAGMDVGRARKALGNAVAVPCAEVIGRALVNVMKGTAQ